jgi:hypothetical protein
MPKDIDMTENENENENENAILRPVPSPVSYKSKNNLLTSFLSSAKLSGATTESKLANFGA